MAVDLVRLLHQLLPAVAAPVVLPTPQLEQTELQILAVAAVEVLMEQQPERLAAKELLF